jgi:hydrogenase maturation factor
MVLVIEPGNLSRVESALSKMGEDFYLIGQVTENKGKERVRIK